MPRDPIDEKKWKEKLKNLAKGTPLWRVDPITGQVTPCWSNSYDGGGTASVFYTDPLDKEGNPVTPAPGPSSVPPGELYDDHAEAQRDAARVRGARKP
jgi:hypothetical protein